MSTERGATAKFTRGDRVKVSRRYPNGHHRTPWYIQGRRGVVLEFRGMYLNSETRAHGDSGMPELPMYRVEFEQTHLWSDYAESPSDQLWIDLYEHWLERAE